MIDPLIIILKPWYFRPQFLIMILTKYELNLPLLRYWTPLFFILSSIRSLYFLALYYFHWFYSYYSLITLCKSFRGEGSSIGMTISCSFKNYWIYYLGITPGSEHWAADKKTPVIIKNRVTKKNLCIIFPTNYWNNYCKKLWEEYWLEKDPNQSSSP